MLGISLLQYIHKQAQLLHGDSIPGCLGLLLHAGHFVTPVHPQAGPGSLEWNLHGAIAGRVAPDPAVRSALPAAGGKRSQPGCHRPFQNGSERESDGTATFTQLSSPAEPRGTRRWSPPSAWPSTADTAGSYTPGRG